MKMLINIFITLYTQLKVVTFSSKVVYLLLLQVYLTCILKKIYFIIFLNHALKHLSA